MAQKVFYSFNYDTDNQRVAQVRNMGVVVGQPLLSSNEWEDVSNGGESAIKQWISDEMSDKNCVVVLVGSSTAGRKWVNYEFSKAWSDRKGVVGIRIHNLKNLSGAQANKGKNPFSGSSVGVGATKRPMDAIVKLYDPPFLSSTHVYDHIKSNITDWVTEAVGIRKSF